MQVSRIVHMLGGLLAAALAAIAPAMAQTITDGSIVFGSSYAAPSSYGDYPPPIGRPVFNYTNGAPSAYGAAGVVSNGQAVSSASLVNDQLQVFASASSENYANAAAETWDTLNFGNLPALGGAVNASTVIGSLTLTVQSAATAGFTNGATAFGLQIYNPATFGPSTNPASNGDCGNILFYTCTGLIAWANNGGALENGLPFGTGDYGTTSGGPAPLTLGTTTYSVPITLGMLGLDGGMLSYTAEVDVENNGPCTNQEVCPVAQINADPSVALTGLYAGVTVSSTSGVDYLSPVPLPAAAWLLLSGLGGLVLMGRRRIARQL
jgi:hypothetical protein